MTWSALAEVDAISADAEASLSATAAAPAAVPVPTTVIVTNFGASKIKGDGMRLAQKLKKDGYTEEQAMQKFIEGKWSESHVTKMMERFNSTDADADAEKTPSVSKKKNKKGDGKALAKKYKAEGKHAYDCKVALLKMDMVETSASRTIKEVYEMSVKEYTKKYGPSAAQAAAAPRPEDKKWPWEHGVMLAEKCFNEGKNPIQCKKMLKKAGLKRRDYLCKLIKRFWKMPVTEWKNQNPEEAQKHNDDSDSDEEEQATAASGSGLTAEQRAQVPTVGETAPAASSLPMPRFAFESLD